MNDLKEMKKDELIELVVEMECLLMWLENKFGKGKKFKKGRKEMVLDILKRGVDVSISDIGKEIGITNRNVSSLLSYLRDDEIEIMKIGRGKGLLRLA